MHNHRTSLNALAIALITGTAASTPASAIGWDYVWTPQTNCGGTTVGIGTSPYFAQYKTTGGNASLAGFADNRFTACVDMTIKVDYTYTSTDVGTYDSAYIQINGTKTTLATNATQGTFSRTFTLNKGDVVRLGVTTTDGQYGPGVLTYNVTSSMVLPYDAFGWTLETLSGTATVTGTPPTLQVSGTAAAPGRARVVAPYLAKATIAYNGTFNFAPAATGGYAEFFFPDCLACYSPFISNSIGPVSDTYIINYIGYPTNPFWWSGLMGIDVRKYGSGTSTLALDRFTATVPVVYPSHIKFTTSTGGTNGTATLGLPAQYTIVGGNNAIAGDTKISTTAPTAACVQAEVTYTSPDVGCNDSVFYVINGVKTTIACNGSPGTKQVSFYVNRGDTWGLGVNTTNGLGGAGTAVFKRLRVFADADATDGMSGPICTADCDLDGALTADDMICFMSL